MKKYIISISLMVIITGALLISCQKEAVLETVQQTKSADQLLEERILGFENITKNPTKSGATMQLDSVLWYSEALLNYSNAEAYEELGVMTVFKKTFSLADYSDELTQTELAQLFSQFQQTISEELNESDIFVYADVQLVESELKSSDEVVLVLGTSDGETNPYVFHDNDWWHSNFQAGRCGAYVGTGDGADAADVIAAMANRRRGSVGGVYFPVVEPVEISHWDDYYPNPWGFFDTYLFANDAEVCLSPEQMEFYTNRLVEVTALHPHSNSNYILIAYEVQSDCVVPTSNPEYLHRGESIYGEPHVKLPND